MQSYPYGQLQKHAFPGGTVLSHSCTHTRCTVQISTGGHKIPLLTSKKKKNPHISQSGDSHGATFHNTAAEWGLWKTEKTSKCVRSQYMISPQNKKYLFPLFRKRESWMWLWVCTMTRIHSIMLGRLQFCDEKHEHVFMYPTTKACDCMPAYILRHTHVDQVRWRQKHKFAHMQL